MVTEHEIVDVMISAGGRFVANLGQLFCLADDDNRARLRAAFPEYWEEYRELAELRKLKRERATTEAC